MNPRLFSRRFFIKIGTLASLSAGILVRTGFPRPRGAAEAAGTSPPTDPPPTTADLPFLEGGDLRRRGEQIAIAYNRPAVAEAFRTQCYYDVVQAVRSQPLEIQNAGASEFFQIFPNGDRLASLFLTISSVNWASPDRGLDIDSLAAEHALARGLPPASVAYLDPRDLPTAGPILRYRPGDSTLWAVARQADRRGAAVAAAEIMEAAAVAALESAGMRLPPLPRTLFLDFGMVARYAARMLVLLDVARRPDAASPFLRLLSGGLIPLGIGPGESRLLAINVSR